jgi:hypothetical protein
MQRDAQVHSVRGSWDDPSACRPVVASPAGLLSSSILVCRTRFSDGCSSSSDASLMLCFYVQIRRSLEGGHIYVCYDIEENRFESNMVVLPSVCDPLRPPSTAVCGPTNPGADVSQP